MCLEMKGDLFVSRNIGEECQIVTVNVGQVKGGGALDRFVDYGIFEVKVKSFLVIFPEVSEVIFDFSPGELSTSVNILMKVMVRDLPERTLEGGVKGVSLLQVNSQLDYLLSRLVTMLKDETWND